MPGAVRPMMSWKTSEREPRTISTSRMQLWLKILATKGKPSLAWVVTRNLHHPKQRSSQARVFLGIRMMIMITSMGIKVVMISKI